MDALYKLEQANGFGHGLGHWIRNFLREGINFAPNFAGNVAGDQVVDLINARQIAGFCVGQIDPRVNE